MTTAERLSAVELSGLLGGDGYLDRKLAISGWPVPPVEIRGDQLLWPQKAAFSPSKRARPDRVPLEGFAALATADDRAILRYAKRWGPLRICVHGLFQGHQEGTVVSAGQLERVAVATGMTGYCDLLQTGDGYYWEPVSAWRRYATRAYGFLKIVRSLINGEPGSLEDWKAVTGIARITCKKVRLPLPRIALDRMEVCARISSWMHEGRVRPYVSWESETPKLEFTSEGLYGALGLQLATVTARSVGFEICSNCGAYFAPRPHAVRGTRRYCNTCSENGVPARDATRAHRARQRQLKQRA